MFIPNPFAAKSPSALDAAITDLYSKLTDYDPTTPEYASASDQVVKLVKLKKETDSPWIPSPDAVVGAAASVASVVLILNYEKIGVVASKAVGFVQKLK